MSDTTVSLRHQIQSAGELQSVVRTMKSVAAASVGQYERSVSALGDYYHAVELGLHACIAKRNQSGYVAESKTRGTTNAVTAIVFGSDQGLVGQFNDVIADYSVTILGSKKASFKVWAVGERVDAQLTSAGFEPVGVFSVPTSVKSISVLVGQVIVQSQAHQSSRDDSELYLFYNRPAGEAGYAPYSQRLLPLDEAWRRKLSELVWPTNSLPEVMGNVITTLESMLREYLFVSLFRACAESLASENASRLAAMQRADKNIDELLETLNGTFHRLRQSGIDEELFDVVSGFEALSAKK